MFYRTSTRTFGATLAALLGLAACTERPGPTAVVSARTPGPSFDFTNGPSGLPNIFRGDRRVFFAWADFDRDLAILINAPADPSDLFACGGTQPPPDLVHVQRVGQLQEVLKQVGLAREVSIFVYQPAPPTFADLCAATPIGRGMGDFTATDNDLLGTGNGANAFGVRARGTVQLVSGGIARVTANALFVFKPDGTFGLFAANVMLGPSGLP
jgi:hypothetical protein